MIKWGKPVLEFEYSTIKSITFGVLFLNIIGLIYCIHIFVVAVQTKINVGNYINMVSANDGNVLPTILALSGLLSLPLHIISKYFLYKVFSKKEQHKLNTFMYIFIMVIPGIILIDLIMCCMILAHSYSSHEGLHITITDAMNNYSSNSLLKNTMDTLQLEFQCCGSKNYQEWYDIEWYDVNLVRTSTEGSDMKKQTPFSCCSLKSPFVCIHHGIESHSLPYRNTEELSLSTSGCIAAIKSKKISVGWNVLGHICVILVFEAAVVVGLRFIQTAHSVSSCFDNDDATYTSWLIGYYQRSEEKPPPVPPVPEELKN